MKSIGKVLETMASSFAVELTSDSQGTPPNHPVALALYDASRKVDLPAYHLKRIIDARVR